MEQFKNKECPPILSDNMVHRIKKNVNFKLVATEVGFALMGDDGVFPKCSRDFIKFSEFSEFGESEKSLKPE